MGIQKIAQSDYTETVLQNFLELSDCPKYINYTGALPAKDNTKFLTIVGSRAHSEYAKRALEHLIKGLSAYSIVIVSGLALGIDGLAHKLAIENGLQTIAVPGSGLDKSVLYPASHKQLAKHIVEHGGCLISEFENDLKSTPWTFPKRNRLMARMADLVLVVEASEKSGTLITARNAAEYAVDVAVIPNSIFSQAAIGSNELLKQGAHPVFSANDILELLGISSVDVPHKTYDDVNETEQLVLNSLIEPLSRETLEDKTGFDSQTLSQNLTLLEIKGHIKESVGKIYKI